MALSNHIAYGCGVFLIISGIIIGFAWPLIYDFISKQRLTLSPASETFKLWVKTPLPMYMEIYLFNWTNSEDFLKDKRVKPQFEQVGPFVFQEVHQRVNVSWNANDTVTYNQTRTWTFVPEESVDLSTPITNLNVILTTITRMASYYKDIIKIILDFLYMRYKEKLLISRPAREWLFDGISDELLTLLRKYKSIPYDKFGWFYGRNLSSSFDGRFTINTGGDNIYHLGALQDWNYVNRTEFYEGECGVVRGSSGELFSPIGQDRSNLTIFVSDFCGSLTLKYAGERFVRGLSGHHYIGDETVFDNGTSEPRAKCYCSGECSPAGVRNVTSCRQAPLFISFPHFYLADSVYKDSVTGMNPNKSEHEFYLSIEPLTGIPLEVRAQLQLNVLLEPDRLFPMFKDVPKIYVPMIWFRQRTKVTPDLASKAITLRNFVTAGPGFACGLAVLGLLIIIIRLCFVKYCSESKNFELLVSPDNGQEETAESRTDESDR